MKGIRIIALVFVCIVLAGSYCGCSKSNSITSSPPPDNTAQVSASGGDRVDDLKKLFMDDETFTRLFAPIAEECIAVSDQSKSCKEGKYFSYLFDRQAFFSEFTYEGKPIPSSKLEVSEQTAELIKELKELCPNLRLSLFSPRFETSGVYLVSFATLFSSPIDVGEYDSEVIYYCPHDSETDFFDYSECLRENWYYEYAMFPKHFNGRDS
ncbi:MAG: hypothetical protein IKO51_11715 [Clostridia bacterium]|nr:hypothetical protein [Clostridia bacterium]